MLIQVRLYRMGDEIGVRTSGMGRTAYTPCRDRETALCLKHEAEHNTVTREFLHGVRDTR